MLYLLHIIQNQVCRKIIGILVFLEFMLRLLLLRLLEFLLFYWLFWAVGRARLPIGLILLLNSPILNLPILDKKEVYFSGGYITRHHNSHQIDAIQLEIPSDLRMNTFGERNRFAKALAKAIINFYTFHYCSTDWYTNFVFCTHNSMFSMTLMVQTDCVLEEQNYPILLKNITLIDK